jgi:hypothetical protein
MRTASAASIIVPAHAQLERVGQADPPQQPLRPAEPGDDPELDLGLAELRRLRRIDEVAGQRQLAAAAEREPVDRRDHRDRQRRQRLAHRVALARELPRLRLGHRRHRRDVGPGDERLARAGQHEPADRPVRGGRPGRAHRLRQISDDRDAQRVEHRRSVHRDHADRAAILDEQRLERHRRHFPAL